MGDGYEKYCPGTTKKKTQKKTKRFSEKLVRKKQKRVRQKLAVRKKSIPDSEKLEVFFLGFFLVWGATATRKFEKRGEIGETNNRR